MIEINNTTLYYSKDVFGNDNGMGRNKQTGFTI
jgi:hypothetical protein